MNTCFAVLKWEQHPGKTFIEHIDKGFDFFGYHFTRGALTLANQTIQHFWEHLQRLYEQLQATPDRTAQLGDYVIR